LKSKIGGFSKFFRDIRLRRTFETQIFAEITGDDDDDDDDDDDERMNFNVA